MPDVRTNSGQALPRFGFGTMRFGAGADEADSAELAGRLVASECGDVFIATKCGHHGACRSRTETEFGAVRKRLNPDAVDLLHLHRRDGETPLEEAFETLAGFMADGSVRAVGASSHAVWQVMKARARGRDVEIRFLQPICKPVRRQADVEILPKAIADDLAAGPRSPLGGLLAGKCVSGDIGRLHAIDTYAIRCRFGRTHEAAANPVRTAEEVGAAPAAVPAAWAAQHPGIWGPIISARPAEQRAPSFAAINSGINDAHHARLSAPPPAPRPATDRLEKA